MNNSYTILKKSLFTFYFFLAANFLLPHHLLAQGITITQGNGEASVGCGQFFFLGDLGGGKGIGTKFLKDVNLPATSFNFNIGFKYYLTDAIAARFTFTQGSLKGADSLITTKGGDEDDRKARNLSFKSPVTEFVLGADIYPFALFERQNNSAFSQSVYVTAGAGIMMFNPKARDLNGSWVALQPLNLEGQGMSEYPDRKKYGLVQPLVELGMGAKFRLSERSYCGIEILHRFLYTDYIDDVSTTYIDPALFDKYLSRQDAAVAKRFAFRQNEINANAPTQYAGDQRGNPKNADAYFSCNITFGYTLFSKSSFSKQVLSQTKCPVIF